MSSEDPAEASVEESGPEKGLTTIKQPQGLWRFVLHGARTSTTPALIEGCFDLVEEGIRVAAQADVGNAQDAIAVEGDGVLPQCVGDRVGAALVVCAVDLRDEACGVPACVEVPAPVGALAHDLTIRQWRPASTRVRDEGEFVDGLRPTADVADEPGDGTSSPQRGVHLRRRREPLRCGEALLHRHREQRPGRVIRGGERGGTNGCDVLARSRNGRGVQRRHVANTMLTHAVARPNRAFRGPAASRRTSVRT